MCVCVCVQRDAWPVRPRSGGPARLLEVPVAAAAAATDGGVGGRRGRGGVDTHARAGAASGGPHRLLEKGGAGGGVGRRARGIGVGKCGNIEGELIAEISRRS